MPQGRIATHGESGKGDIGDVTIEYTAGQNMRKRCMNLSDPNYINYGFAGIIICARWNAYMNFLDDMGRCPPNHSLERIDNYGAYSPENCKWATSHEQCRNKCNNVWLDAENKQMIQKDWAKELNISETTLRRHLKSGKAFHLIVEDFRVRRRLNLPPFYKGEKL